MSHNFCNQPFEQFFHQPVKWSTGFILLISSLTTITSHLNHLKSLLSYSLSPTLKIITTSSTRKIFKSSATFYLYNFISSIANTNNIRHVFDLLLLLPNFVLPFLLLLLLPQPQLKVRETMASVIGKFYILSCCQYTLSKARCFINYHWRHRWLSLSLLLESVLSSVFHRKVIRLFYGV